MINDFGTMMEIRLFGGHIEHKEPLEGYAFSIDEILLYDHPKSTVAFIAKWKKEIFSDIDIASNCKLEKGEDFDFKDLASRRKRLLPQTRCSGKRNDYYEENEFSDESDAEYNYNGNGDEVKNFNVRY